MNTRRWRGGVGFPVASCLSSCLLASWAMLPSSSRSAWIAHCPNVRSLPGATCRCRSNRYSKSSAAGWREPACLSVSSVPVSRAVCRYSRVICCGPLSSSCGCSFRPASHRRSALACPSSSGLTGSRFDCIIWRGRAWLSCGDGKKTGAGLFPVPLLARLLFLASANYAPISTNLVIALGGLTEAGLTVLVRVELDGNSGLVLVSFLLVRLAALEKHCQSFHRAGLLFFPAPCLLNTLYGLGAVVLVSFPTCGDKNTISGRRTVSAACLSLVSSCLSWASLRSARSSLRP